MSDEEDEYGKENSRGFYEDSCKNIFKNIFENTLKNSYKEFLKESLKMFEEDKHVCLKVLRKKIVIR